ncbi:MAG: general secretion pathway protein GspK [Thermodesulfobacteriota bacterium]
MKNLKQKSDFLFSEKKKNNPFFSQKGVALVLTLIMVTLLAGWALSLNLKVRDVLFQTNILKKRMMLHDRAREGIRIGQALLVKDRMTSETDSIQEFWADKEEISAYLSLLGYSEDELKIEITDVLSKIQINALVNFPNTKNDKQIKLWERFLDGLKTEYPELIENPYEIINPMLDWLDYDDDNAVTGLSGAEKPYYESENILTPRNGPMKSIEELSYVKGINDKLWDKVYNSGIAQKFLTVHGDVTRSGKSFNYKGKININTAPKEVVAALITDNAFYHMAEEICSLREEKSDEKFVYNLEGKWYKQCPGCEDVPLDEDLITTSSNMFEVSASASDKDTTVKVKAVVRRYTDKDGKWNSKIETWITE